MPRHDTPTTHSPLSGWDEYPIHQNVAPVRYVATSDPRAFERYWFTAQSRDGSVFLITGMGFYPNLGVADAYALLVHGGRQVTVRAHRRLSPDRADMQVGPIRFDPRQPFAAWGLSLGENEQGLRFDLTWRDTKRPRFSRPDFSKFPWVPENMHLLHDWGGYETFGEIEGTIQLGDTSITLTGDRFIGSRDHHWGIRDGVGGLHISPPKRGFSHCAQFVEFKEWAIWGGQVLHNLTSTARGPLFAKPIDYQFSFDPDTRHFREAIVTNQLSNGETKRLHFKAIEHMTAFLRCGGYAGPDGSGTPDENYLHGQGVGAAVTGQVHDVTDRATRLRLGGFEDHLCTVTCDGETSVGIFECMNPAIFEMCEAGYPGFSFMDEKALA